MEKVNTVTMNYMLRKTMIPWRMEETIEEVLSYCQVNHVGEVIWKIDVEMFNKGFTTLERIGEYLPWLKKAKGLFDEAGIATSINPWITINHSDYGRDSREVFPKMRWMVDYTGVQSRACACPLCSEWQDYLVNAYSLYAEVRPHVLWLEDDFRHFNHSPVEWGCFCDLHLTKFGELIGEKITREELVSSILKPGDPHSLRAKWMDFLGENMVAVSREVSAAVHEVSPETKLGLMSSDPDDHSVEGRKWHDLLNGFGDGNRPVSRPHYPPYRHTTMFDPYIGPDMIRKTVHCLPAGTQVCPELENATFTEYVKSVKMTRMQMLLSAAMGYRDLTMNLYDHCGTPLEMDDAYGVMLREAKGLADGLLKYCREGGQERGVRLLFSPTVARFSETRTGNSFEELHSRGAGWSTALQAMGHAVTYMEGPVCALTGQTTRGYSKEELKEILSGGVLLDASATETLIQDGYGEYLGVDVLTTIKRGNLPFAAEDVGDGVYISPRLGTETEMLCRLHLHDGAEAVSHLIDYNQEVLMPGMVYFENSLGGRVAVYLMDLRDGVTCCFMSWHRRNQFEKALRWLSRDRLGLFVNGGVYSLPMRRDYEGYSTVAIVNGSPDSWDEITVEMALEGRAARSILMVDEAGEWGEVRPSQLEQNDERLIFTVDKELGYLDLAVFCIQY